LDAQSAAEAAATQALELAAEEARLALEAAEAEAARLAREAAEAEAEPTITGMCTGNTDGSSVDCSDTNQQNIANYATTAGTDAVTCCQNITGMCSGNTISSEDIDCSSGGYNNKPNIFNIVGNSFDDCCRGRCSEQICGAPNLETNNGLCSGLDCTDSECCSVPSGRTTNLYWVKGNPGEDCNTVCSANSMICSDVPANSGDLYSWAGASGGDSDDVRNYIADNTYVSGTNQLVPLNICRAGSSSSASTSHVVPSIRTQNSQDPSCFMPEQIEGHRFASCPANRTNYSRICRCQG